MDNQNQDSEDQADNTTEVVDNSPEPPPAVDEREMLKARARILGVEFSNNIGTDTLKERIRAKLEGTEVSAPVSQANAFEAAIQATVEAGQPSDVEVVPAVQAKPKNLRQQIRDEQMKLVRVRVTCMDPKKKDLHGEIFTIANEYLGTVRKFVPFGEVTEDGYHVPFCIYQMMKEREFLNIRTTKDPRTKELKVESNYAKEFALEVLPPLSQDDLNRLATAQAAAGSVG